MNSNFLRSLAVQFPVFSTEFLRVLDNRFTLLMRVQPEHRELVNATAAAVSFYLPDGQECLIDYVVVKTDASGNAVTVYPKPDSGQTILGATSLVLAARYSKTRLTYNRSTADWVTV